MEVLDTGRKASGFADPAISLHERLDGDRGRIYLGAALHATLPRRDNGLN
jgi:hypothetical protein